IGIGAYAGTDYNGLDRREIPLTLDMLFYFNPQSRLQVYGLLGTGVSFGEADGYRDHRDGSFSYGTWESHEYIHWGGSLGLGLELRLGERFALNGDIRAFMRTRINDDERPEFIDADTGETTNTSGGALGTFGATFYF